MKFDLQDDQYQFPYHYVPHINPWGTPVRTRHLRWGFEYLCYLFHIRDMALELQPSTVLDVGCGDGRLLGLLAGKIPTCTGVDLSERAINLARGLHPEVAFHAIDAADLDAQYDLTIAMETLEHIPDDALTHFLTALYQRTRPGGRVIISVPTTVIPLNPKHYRHYTLELLQAQIDEAGLALTRESVAYIYQQPPLLRLYTRLTLNRLWTVELNPVNTLIWRTIWKKRRTTPQRGHHLIVQYQKP